MGRWDLRLEISNEITSRERFPMVSVQLDSMRKIQLILAVKMIIHTF